MKHWSCIEIGRGMRPERVVLMGMFMFLAASPVFAEETEADSTQPARLTFSMTPT